MWRSLESWEGRVGARSRLFIVGRLMGRGFTSDPNHLRIYRVLCATFGGHWSIQISFCENPKSAPINDVSNQHARVSTRRSPPGSIPVWIALDTLAISAVVSEVPFQCARSLYVRSVRVGRQSAPADLESRIETRDRGFTLTAP